MSGTPVLLERLQQLVPLLVLQHAEIKHTQHGLRWVLLLLLSVLV